MPHHFTFIRHPKNLRRHPFRMKAIGQLVKEELERQERSVTWFARKLSCHRSNVYDIFARDNMDISLLVRISTILRHNFLQDLADSVAPSLS